MCGIVGYIGKNQALPVLIDGLKTLEYRGYDSAGVAVLAKNHLKDKRSVGQVAVLEAALQKQKIFRGNLGIGHTRWATHGVPNTVNAHPHHDCKKQVSVAHNGIIENYQEIRSYLEKRGHKFRSATDTETIPHLIEDHLRTGVNFETALFDTLKMLRGAYALAVIDARNPDVLYAAKLSSPLVIGVGVDENFLASDPSALIGKTKKVIYLKDGEVAKITKTSVAVTNHTKKKSSPEIVQLEGDLTKTQKGEFPHFMLKEIFEGAAVVRWALQGRVLAKEGLVKLGGLDQVGARLRKTERLIILACGTSYYAGLVGEYLLEAVAGLPTEVHLASEFRYRDEPYEASTAVIAISQSGETADTLAALRKAKQHGLLTIGIVNSVGSGIARKTDAGIYNHAGPEIGVASTKAFLSQLTILTLLSIYLANQKNKKRNKAILKELLEIPTKIETILAQATKLERLAEKYQSYESFLFVGRHYNYPVALEGALKLKEVSYVHAEGYAAGEMKHGPIALISPWFPTMAIVPQNAVTEKMYSNLEEIRARGGPIVAIATTGDKKISSLANDVFYLPKTIEALEPFLSAIPLQLFAYYVGVKRGHNVDRPRNLAKSVTVE